MTELDDPTPRARIHAVVVAFAPDPARFQSVLARALEQAEIVLVADNGNGVGLESTAWWERLRRIDMHGNAGVAAAQNAGLRQAFADGASHVLLLDHDSVLGNGAVAALVRAWQLRSAAGQRVAAVGANYRDPRRPASSPFIRIRGWRYTRPEATPAEPIVATSYLVSSGSLISRDAFDAVGPMNESLFIDYVDIEWGLRAGCLGWHCFGVADAELEHVLGNGSMRILGTDYPLHPPLRHYYMTRNGVWLALRAALPLRIRCVEGWRLLKRCLAYAAFAPEPHLHRASMLSGLRDGLRDRLGTRRSAASKVRPEAT